ncbi:MAG TPA: DNA polymerase III subunit delta [Stellaceae bacterium]|nr:DNA polymerase III subunit delta [Stellaceae bacterium]
MKLAPARLSAFLAAPDAAIRAALFYGPDAGLVRERADRLAAAIVPDRKDPFRIADLAAAALTADPARLHDEAAALSLTGGRRLVRVRDAGDTVGALFQRFLGDPPPGDSMTLVEAGELAPRSSLRRAFESAANGAAVACYSDDRRALEELAREVLGGHRIELASEALHYLAQHLGGDRLLSRGELEKLALYVGDGGKVTLAEAMASVGDSAQLDLDDVVFAAADGDTPALERALTRAFLEGEMPVSVLRALMRHFQRLHLTQARIAEGMSEEEALRSLRPPLFFKLQDRFRRQLRLWPERRAQQALELLLQAELLAKRSGPPPEAVCRDALLRIARRAGEAARR